MEERRSEELLSKIATRSGLQRNLSQEEITHNRYDQKNYQTGISNMTFDLVWAGLLQCITGTFAIPRLY